jgi:hypothetical protein
MSTMRDALDRLEVVVKSTDQTLLRTVSGSPAKVRVDLRSGYERHTDESLARQLEGAARIGAMAYRQAVTNAWKQAAGLADEEQRDG